MNSLWGGIQIELFLLLIRKFLWKLFLHLILNICSNRILQIINRIFLFPPLFYYRRRSLNKVCSCLLQFCGESRINVLPSRRGVFPRQRASSFISCLCKLTRSIFRVQHVSSSIALGPGRPGSSRGREAPEFFLSTTTL